MTDSATDVARQWNVGGYLCPNMEHNPWSPLAPGKHGYMQQGLGLEKETFVRPEEQHVFVGVGSTKQYIYCGKYRLWRVERLTQEEWKALPENVRMHNGITPTSLICV